MIAGVLEVRAHGVRREAILDVGYPEWPQMHAHRHRLYAYRHGRWEPFGAGADRIGGRTCLEYDRIDGVALPRALQAGDRILIADTGSYDRSMSFAFAQGEAAHAGFSSIAARAESAYVPMNSATYLLPLRRWHDEPGDQELFVYLAALVQRLPVIVVDGSSPDRFEQHARRLDAAIVHVPVDADRRGDRNGKVAGIVTGLRRVATPFAIVADDDVRYDETSMNGVVAALADADVVLPQNVFAPCPWHALLDTGRTLIARATGGDWSGTLALRTAAFARAGGYDGDVLFENLELVRTIAACGGRVRRLDGVFVVRRPPEARRFFEQRARQAYDELARPLRLVMQLALAPTIAVAMLRVGVRSLALAVLGAVALAEAGRRRAGGARALPVAASLVAPLWVLERALTAWIALALRLRGGVRYAGGRLDRAATPQRILRRRYRRVMAA